MRSWREAEPFRLRLARRLGALFRFRLRRRAAALERRRDPWRPGGGGCAACCCAKAAALAFFGFGFLARSFRQRLAGLPAACAQLQPWRPSAFWRASSASLRLNFSYGISAGFGFAILSGFLFGGDSGCAVFLGLLFYGNDAGFFGGLHDFARGGDHGFFCRSCERKTSSAFLSCCSAFGERGSGVSVS